MMGFLTLIFVATSFIAFVAIIVPFPKLWLPTRGRAALACLASVILLVIVVPKPTPEEKEVLRLKSEELETERENKEREERWKIIRAEKERLAEMTVFIPATSLIREYEANPLRANKKYKGKIMKVAGKVHSIEESIFGSPQLTFGSGFETLTATFDDESELLKVNPGALVTIICEEVASGTMGGANLEDCTFAP